MRAAGIRIKSLSLTASGGTASRDLENLLDPGNRIWTLLGNLAQEFAEFLVLQVFEYAFHGL